ncbi:hypothetical protein [Azospirillum sp.]|uniref:hypothetical protein n=1 Tax=Azospirillum sp. TaxID=34012 RepID=UPI002D63D6FC|nr:hypothetical protein [Azospirillum sp.]HYD66992.1 hypothetical protein [Azospirillum sp.]
MAEGNVTNTVSAVDRLTAPVRTMNEALAALATPFERLTVAVRTLGGEAGLGFLEGQVKAVGAGAGAVAGRVAGLAGTVLGVAGTAGIVGGGILRGAAESERQEAMLTTLLGSSAKAKESLGWVDGFAEKTPHTGGDLTEAFIRLTAHGIDARAGALQAVGDAAAATGRPVAQMTEAFTAAAGGRMDRLRDMVGGHAETRNGMVTYTVADQEGRQRVFEAAATDSKALQAMVMEVFKAKGYTGAMDTLSQTWSGMWTRLTEAVSGFGQMIADAGAFDILKDKLHAVLDLIGRWKADGTLQTWAKGISDAFTGAMQAVEGKLAGVNLGTVFDDVASAASRIAQTVGRVVAWLGGWENAVIVVAVALNAQLIVAVGQLTAGLAGLAAGVVRVGASMAVMVAGGVVSGIGTFIASVRSGTGVMAAFNAVLSANPIGVVVMGVAALAAVAYAVWANWETLGELFGAVWDAIASAFFGAVDGIVSLLSGFSPATLLAGAVDAVVGVFTGADLFALGTGWIGGLWDGIASRWTALTAWLSEALAGLTGWLPDWARGPLGISAPGAPPPVPAGGGASAVTEVARAPARPAAAGAAAGVLAPPGAARAAGAAPAAGPPTSAAPVAGVPAASASPGAAAVGAARGAVVNQISAPVAISVTVNGMADIDVLRREVEGAARRAMEDWQWRQQSAAGAALWGGD